MIYFLYKFLLISFYFIYINQVKGDREKNGDWEEWTRKKEQWATH